MKVTTTRPLDLHEYSSVYSRKIQTVPKDTEVTLLKTTLGSPSVQVKVDETIGWFPSAGIDGLKTFDNKFLITKETGGLEFVTTDEYKAKEKNNILLFLAIGFGLVFLK